MNPKLTLTAALAAYALSAGAVFAQAMPTKAVEAPSRWEVNIGGGPVYGFSGTGNDPHKTHFTFWGSATYQDRIYANGLDGLGYNIVKADDFHLGVQLRPSFSGPTDSTIPGPDFGADLAVYAYKRGWKDFIVGARVARDVTGVSDGVNAFASIARQDITKVGLLQTMAYVRAGDQAYNRAYYGVAARDVAKAPGLSAYAPGAGLTQTGIVALMMTPIGEKYAVGSFVNYERVLDKAADSPLTERYGQQDEYRAGMVFVRRFIGR